MEARDGSGLINSKSSGSPLVFSSCFFSASSRKANENAAIFFISLPKSKPYITMKKVLTILCAIALLGSLQAQTADDIIDQYFENIGGRAAWSEMDYLTFIKKGYPISSAMAESTCGHLVKERMEQSSMRWSSNGAQKVMDVRAVNLNGDMEDFMRFVIGSERKIGLRKMAA